MTFEQLLFCLKLFHHQQKACWQFSKSPTAITKLDFATLVVWLFILPNTNSLLLTAASTAAKKYSHSYSGLFFASLQGINLTTRKVTTMVCFSRKVTCSCLVFCLLYIHQVKTRTSGSNSMVTGTNAIIAKGTQNEEMLENQGKHTYLPYLMQTYIQMYCLLYDRRTKMTFDISCFLIRIK